MKKMLSLILALMMLMICPVMAENIVETQLLTSPDGTYSFEVPQGFFTMDADILKTVFAAPEAQQVLAQEMGLQDTSQLDVHFEAMQEANMMIVYGSDMVSNLNVQVAEASLTMDLIVTMKALLDYSMSQQYQGMGVAAEDIHPMDIQQFGGRSWYGTQLVMMGMDVYSMLTIENGIQYVVTFTGLDETVMQHVLESFTIVAPAAQ